jgi:integrase
MSAGNRNEFRSTLTGFCNWCAKPSVQRLLTNPFADIPKVKGNKSRTRRAMTEIELATLLETAQRRPLAEALMIRRGPRKGQQVAKVADHVRERLERTGLERALIYKAFLLTGLRKNELATLTIGQLYLGDGFLQLRVADEKNREGNRIPLRADLAADLKAWVADRASTELVFRVPKGLLRILNRDLAAAGIKKKGERGRTLDVHALRHSFSTLLSRGGVAPRTAQAAMRHSSIDLTMNTYTDPKLLAVKADLDVLPPLPVAPNVALTPAHSCESGLIRAKMEKVGAHPGEHLKSWPINTKSFVVTTYDEASLVERKGVEPSTSALRTSPRSRSEVL